METPKPNEWLALKFISKPSRRQRRKQRAERKRKRKRRASEQKKIQVKLRQGKRVGCGNGEWVWWRMADGRWWMVQMGTEH